MKQVENVGMGCMDGYATVVNWMQLRARYNHEN